MATSDQFAKSAWMLASVAVVVAALYLAKGVLPPMALAVLLSFLLSPVCDWLERFRLGRIPAVLLTVIMGFTVLGAATWTAVVQVTDLAPKLLRPKVTGIGANSRTAGTSSFCRA
jgi:predicted PurR-regulated permease PerM